MTASSYLMALIAVNKFNVLHSRMFGGRGCKSFLIGLANIGHYFDRKVSIKKIICISILSFY